MQCHGRCEGQKSQDNPRRLERLRLRRQLPPAQPEGSGAVYQPAPPPARHPLDKRSGTGRHRPWPDERQAAAESRGTDALHHRPAETN